MYMLCPNQKIKTAIFNTHALFYIFNYLLGVKYLSNTYEGSFLLY